MLNGWVLNRGIWSRALDACYIDELVGGSASMCCITEDHVFFYSSPFCCWSCLFGCVTLKYTVLAK